MAIFFEKLILVAVRSGREQEENDGRNYFMINLHKVMGPGRNQTRDPWICSQTGICCQTRYRLPTLPANPWFECMFIECLRMMRDKYSKTHQKGHSKIDNDK